MFVRQLIAARFLVFLIGRCEVSEVDQVDELLFPFAVFVYEYVGPCHVCFPRSGSAGLVFHDIRISNEASAIDKLHHKAPVIGSR